MNERKGAFLDNGSSTPPISLEINDEEPNLAIKLREREAFLLLDVLWHLIVFSSLDLGFQAIQIDSRVEWLQVLAIVGLRIELEHPNVDCVNILNVKPELNALIWFELIFVLRSERERDLITYLLVPVLRHGLVLDALESIL